MTDFKMKVESIAGALEHIVAAFWRLDYALEDRARWGPEGAFEDRAYLRVKCAIDDLAVARDALIKVLAQEAKP